MEIRNEIPSTRTPRGLGALIRQFFGWRHLVLVGATCCLALSLLCYLYIAASRMLIAYVLCPLSLVLFAIMLIKGGLMRYLDMKLLLAAFVWLNVVYIANAGRTDLAASLPYYTNACAVALLCFPLAYALRRERRMKTFDLLSALWVILIVCSAIFAIVLALTDTVLYRQSDMAIMGIYRGRLILICDSSMYGMLLCIAICLIFYLLLGRRRPLVKLLLALAALCLYVALTMTGSRTSELALLPVAFFFASLPVWRCLKRRKRFLRLLAGALAGAAFSCVLLFGYRGVTNGMNALIAGIKASQQTAAHRPSALAVSARELAPSVASEVEIAPTPLPEVIMPREFAVTRSVNERLQIWKHVCGLLPQEKDVLLRGATPALAHDMFLQDVDPHYTFNHFHNAYLGVLVAYGIPGVLLMLAFFIYLAICACRLLFSARSDLPLSIRFLPTILLAILAINLFEEMLFTLDFVGKLDVWLGIIGGYTIVLSREWGGKTPQPADVAQPAPAPD